MKTFPKVYQIFPFRVNFVLLLFLFVSSHLCNFRIGAKEDRVPEDSGLHESPDTKVSGTGSGGKGPETVAVKSGTPGEMNRVPPDTLPKRGRWYGW